MWLCESSNVVLYMEEASADNCSSQEDRLWTDLLAQSNEVREGLDPERGIHSNFAAAKLDECTVDVALTETFLQAATLRGRELLVIDVDDLL